MALCKPCHDYVHRLSYIDPKAYGRLNFVLFVILVVWLIERLLRGF